jgi:serpin B
MKFAILRRTGMTWLLLPAAYIFAVFTGNSATPTANSATARISGASNAFALDLYAKLAGEREAENLFFSPASIEMALAMTCAGARGSTASQMAGVLHLPPGTQTIHEDFSGFLDQLYSGRSAEEYKRGYQLSIANALWGQGGYKFLPRFMNLIEKKYGARLGELDFKSDSEGARRTINAWVEKKTRDRIKDLIGRGVLSPDTRLVLTNAIYFKGNWADEFEKNATREELFHLSAREQKKVPFMRRTGSCGYMKQESFQMLKLPYVGNDLSMIILLPGKIGGLAALEHQLTLEKLHEWFSRLSEQKVAVSIPKFEVTAQFNLNSTLASLGMSDAFRADRADFSGMNGNRDLFLSDVIHKAFVEVNEEGTEAAAATGVVIELTAARPHSPPPVFRADHPFLFVIREERSGTLLFMGRLADPEPGI